MSRYHRHFKLVASDIGEIAAEWPDRVGWPFIFEHIVKRPYWHLTPPPDDTFILMKFQTDQLRPMEGLDEDSVAEYEAVKPENMPPIILDESFLVIDGSHRLVAAQRRGDKTIWAYVLNQYGEHTKRLHANARMSYHSVIAKLKAETDAPPGFEDARNKWYENPDAILPNEGWWPLSNVYIPTREDNPVFEETVEEYMHMPKPAVIGVTSSHPGAADQKLTTDPPNSDYSFLFVEDGVHRSIAAAREGIGWIRATMQARPSASLSGGYEPIDTSRD